MKQNIIHIGLDVEIVTAPPVIELGALHNGERSASCSFKVESRNPARLEKNELLT